MGAYFSLRSYRKSPSLPLFDIAEPADAKDCLRAGKLVARSLAEQYEGSRRESIARAFTTAIVASYWNEIQKSEPHFFPLPDRFCDEVLQPLPLDSASTAHRMGQQSARLEPAAAAYLISATYTA